MNPIANVVVKALAGAVIGYIAPAIVSFAVERTAEYISDVRDARKKMKEKRENQARYHAKKGKINETIEKFGIETN